MYIVIIEDRHCDVEVKIFNDRVAAISKARDLAKEYCRSPDDLEETNKNGVFHIFYSCEGDAVSVVQADVED